MKLAFVGGIMPGGLVNEGLTQRPTASVWGDTLPILRGADYRIGSGDAKNIAVLTDGGINAVSVGDDLIEAREPLIWKVRDKTVGMISFTDDMPERVKRTKALISLVEETKTKVDILIVAVGWGDDRGYKPPGEHTDLSHALIEAGADIIFGHSTRVFRGVEVYRNKLIIYSAGNFIDDYAVDEIERNDQSFIFVVETNGKGIERVYLYPTLIADFSAQMAKGADRDAIWKKMASLCLDLATKARWNEMRGRLEIVVVWV